MNPTDLRTELSARAAESEGHPYGDLLPGVRRKVRITKARRATTVLAGTAAAAIAVGVLPNLTTTGTPDPADTPKDYEHNGITFQGMTDKGDLLQKAYVGERGRTSVEFDWTPPSKRLTIRTVCWSTAAAVRTTIDGVTVAQHACAESGGDTDVPEDSIIWTHVPDGKVRVRVELEEASGDVARDSTALVGVGLYRTGQRPATMPSRVPSPDPADVMKDGIRYRAKIGGDTLHAARIGGPGEREISFTFTPATARLSIRPYCLAGPDRQANDSYRVNVFINGRSVMDGTCADESDDPGGGGSSLSGLAGAGLPGIRVGQPNTATIRLTDLRQRPATVATARIGLGIYLLGEQRTVDGDGDRIALDELKEYNGLLYRLGEVRTAAASSRSVSIETPAGTPFLVAFGTTDTGIAITRLHLEGLDAETPGMSGPHGAGLSLGAQPSRKAGTATAKILEGSPAKGKVLIAIYTPVR